MGTSNLHTASQSEAQVSTWTFLWHLNRCVCWGVGGQGGSLMGLIP